MIRCESCGCKHTSKGSSTGVSRD